MNNFLLYDKLIIDDTKTPIIFLTAVFARFAVCEDSAWPGLAWSEAGSNSNPADPRQATEQFQIYDLEPRRHTSKSLALLHNWAWDNSSNRIWVSRVPGATSLSSFFSSSIECC
ncbi:hypothetical protein RRG08_014051 [Elysia crispata]|uniref:Uncharacterized protein n=1 Tax=Elysia crispata TaxID=231223 RepID=A0AAE1DPT2_9GAST|nr:hypothetical protein RRG08_014051 [Elysia crispata]